MKIGMKGYGAYNDKEFLRLKQNYLYSIAPKVRALHKMSNAKVIDVFSLWVTEYGDLDGKETNDCTLIDIFTQCGALRDLETPYISLDIAFGEYDNESTHDEIVNIIGRDFYETSKGSEFYRIESSDLDKYTTIVENLIKYLSNEKEEEKIEKNMDTLTTKGTIIPHHIFNDFREDFRALGINYLTNFNEPNNDHFIIPMPKSEVYNNLAERLVDGGYLSEKELENIFNEFTECELEMSINISYVKVVNEKLY